MSKDFREIQVPVIVKRLSSGCDVFIPDLQITIHGQDFVDAIANASMKASAVYFYNYERNTKLPFTKTYAEVDAMSRRHKNWFTTYIALTS